MGFMDFLSFNNLFTVLMGNSLAAYGLWTSLMIEFISIELDFKVDSTQKFESSKISDKEFNGGIFQ